MYYMQNLLVIRIYSWWSCLRLKCMTDSICNIQYIKNVGDSIVCKIYLWFVHLIDGVVCDGMKCMTPRVALNS